MTANQTHLARGTAVAAAIALAAAGLTTLDASASPLEIGDWRASTFSSSLQSQVSLGRLDDGTLVCAWASRRQLGGRSGVYFQRFAADGAALGAETPVAVWRENHQVAPAVATRGGAAWIAWQSFGQDGDGWAVIARRFADDGTAWRGGDEILVNVDPVGGQLDPVIAATPDGGAIVAWVHDEGPVPTVRARRFDAEGRAVTDEHAVCAPEGIQGTPALAVRADGAWAVAFTVVDPATASTGGVWLQRFDARNERRDDAVLLAERGIEPDVVAHGDGWLAAWLEADPVRGDYGARVATIDVQGALGAVQQPCPDGPTSALALAGGADGTAALAWTEGRGAERDVQWVRLDRDGAATGEATRATAASDGPQWLRAASAVQRLVFSRDAIYVAWAGDGGRGDDSAAHVSMISAERRRAVHAGVTGDEPLHALGDAAAPHVPPAFDPKAREARTATSVRRGGTGEIGFTAIVNTGWTPPDPHMAVGPGHVVAMTNGAIAFFTKAGNLTFQDEIEGPGGFWGSVGASTFIFDPEVVYDPMSDRFFAMAADRNSATGHSYALVAVSDDSDPNGTWHKYRFDTTALAGPTFDSPNIGVSADAVYVTGDGFGGPRPYPVFVYDKASLLAGDPPAVSISTWLDTGTQSAGVPPVSFDAPPAIYMVEHGEGGSSDSVRLVAMTDALGSPTFTTTTVTVPSYGPPEDPPQSGTSVRPETFDARFWSCAYRNGSLWATHHAGSSRVLVRWYEFAMNGWPASGDAPELVQSGEIDPGASVRTFFSAITVDDRGNAAVTYARSSPSEFLSMATSVRAASDPLGTMRPGIIWQSASGPYSASRWGDYAAVAVDPVDGRVWAHHESALSSSWRTWVQAFPSPCLPADVDCDGTVGVGDLLAVLAAWGPCPGCPEDVDGDGSVGTTDLLAVLAAWG